MSVAFNPTGMTPVGRVDTPVTGQIREYDVSADNAALIARHEPVALIAGQVKTLAASPTTTFGANTPLGVFMGCSYVDAVRGFVNSPVLPANATTAGLTRIKAQVDVGKNMFSIQANGPVTSAQIGADIGLGGLATGSAFRKTSTAYADVATINQTSGGVAALKIVGIERLVDNVPGDAFTRILVEWNAGVSALEVAGSH